MKFKFFGIFIAYTCLIMLAGCGGGATGGSAPKDTLAESQTCLACHDLSHQGTAVSVTPGTGIPVATEWKASTHNTKNGASCSDCHGSGFLHTSTPASCSGCHGISGQAVNPLKNPDSEDKCANCHAKVNPRPGKSDGFALLPPTPGIPLGSTTAYTHFSTGRHGTYVSTNYKQYCRKCHNPHDTGANKKQRQEWAQSGHGGTRNAFITASNDFKTLGSRLLPQDNQGNYCVRCHTTTGYVTFVKSNFTDTQALPDFNGVRNNYPERPRPTYTDTSREGINCNACHDDGRANDESAYSGRLRAVSAPSIWYMYSSHPVGMPILRARHNIQYDSMGKSNVCVSCHAGREDGKIIKIADIDADLFSYPGASPSGIRPHDFPAAANLQGKSGFDFYTSDSKYSKNPTHKLGIGGTDGPCISCHMKNDTSHSFRPVDWLNDNQAGPIELVRSAGVCSNCHGPGKIQSVEQSVANMNLERDYYRAAVITLGKIVPSTTNWKTKTNNNPVPGSGTPSSIDGTIKDVRGGAYTMGAFFVQVMFFNDPAGYTHNPLYTKQLMYDAFDWLNDGNMNFGNASAQVISTVTTTVTGVAAPGLTWDKGPTPAIKYGQNGVPISAGGVAFTKTQVFKFICKDFELLNTDINNPTVCNRW